MRELMRRYVYGFVNSHDFDVPSSIMHEQYTLHMGSDTLRGRDDVYLPAVRHQFAQFPQLEYSIHELIGTDTLTAVRFSEHGRSLRAPEVAASWIGVAIYRAEGGRLVECWVEQDHFGRRAQLASGIGDPLPPVAVAPWDASRPGEPASSEASAAETEFREWAEGLRQWPPAAATLDPGQASSTQPVLTETEVRVNAIVAEGPTVAANLTVTGRYAGGLPGFDDRIGAHVRTFVGVFADVEAGEVTSVRGVSNRVAVQRALRA
ncbi:ester cyclase [Agromyces aerolatus]|uniref:ester cyclase n=1 Tax=Agromyces sp. LY-1074 TaxID=3074080 RepID=UPI00285E262E|nr:MULTISPECIES: ester cyclase [unclassified Agromyces]MDR5699758.1 ester cyclase [Agromyces sp. LY-1074]MDR5706054.1 ester cyclase [Agromyces sp. LY-1358]